MIRSLNTAATGMVVQQRNLDVIANNLANINTTAFKANRAEFQDLYYENLRVAGADIGGGTQNPGPTQVGLGARFSANASNFGQGALQATSNPLDVTVNGAGFFSVNLPDGTVGYTRDGSFTTNSAGTIVTSSGYPLASNIQIPSDATSISISENGTVSAQLAGQQEPQVLGQILVYTFPNQVGLTRQGSNIFKPTQASGDANETEPGTNGSGTLMQGFLEGSNVEMVQEMVKMILAQRAYEVNSKAIQTSDDMLSVTNQLKR